MTRLTRVALIVGCFLGLASPAVAQSGCGGQVGANQFCGSVAGGLPGWTLIPAGGTTPIAAGTVLGNPAATGTALPSATATPVLGVAGSVVGTLGFRNLTSGSITLQPTTGALGSSVLTLPAITDMLAGYSLANGGTNAPLTASNGGIVWSNASQLQILAGTATARQMLQSGATATPAWSTATWPATTTINQILFSSAANTVGQIATVNGGMLNANSSGVPGMTITPVLGVPTASQGTLGFAGITSGTATITAQATAGTPTLTLPNTTGTFAVGASAPLALSATTGVVSLQGASGTVAAGSGGTGSSFTATPTLGTAGSVVGTLAFANATSGSITLSPPTGALGSVTLTLPDATDTLVARATADTLTNKTLTSSTDVLGGVTMTLGSDATGDIYYRAAGGALTRLGLGSSGQVLSVSASLPAWTSAGATTITEAQGRITLTANTPVMTATATAQTTLRYDCYIGSNVPYYNGSVDLIDTVSSCEVTDAMVSAASAGQVVNNNVYDVWWVHSGANRICLAMSASSGGGGGWSSDSGGSNTARGTGYSQLDRTTRPYVTNKNSIANCFNGSTNYGSVSANQATYLGSIYATANGQTGMNFAAAPASGGGNPILGVYNAYNRVQVFSLSQDNTSSWTYTTASWRAANNSAANRISWVDGLQQSNISCSYTLPVNPEAGTPAGTGVDLDSSTATPTSPAGSAAGITTFANYQTAMAYFLPVIGVHFAQAVEISDGTHAAIFYGTLGSSYQFMTLSCSLPM